MSQQDPPESWSQGTAAAAAAPGWRGTALGTRSHLCLTRPAHSDSSTWNWLLSINQRPFTTDHRSGLDKATHCTAGTMALPLKHLLSPGTRPKWENRTNLCQAQQPRPSSQGVTAKRHSKAPEMRCLPSLNQLASDSKYLKPVHKQSYSAIQLICFRYKNNYIVLAHFCSRRESGFLCQVTSAFHCKVTLLRCSAAKESSGKQRRGAGAGARQRQTCICSSTHLSRPGRLREMKIWSYED